MVADLEIGHAVWNQVLQDESLVLVCAQGFTFGSPSPSDRPTWSLFDFVDQFQGLVSSLCQRLAPRLCEIIVLALFAVDDAFLAA